MLMIRQSTKFSTDFALRRGAHKTSSQGTQKTQCVGDYLLCERVGKGTFGEVYKGKHIHTGEPVAIKLEASDAANVEDARKILKHEYLVYSELTGIPELRIPRVFWCGALGNSFADPAAAAGYGLVMEYIGASLESLKMQCGGRFSLKTTLMLGIQIIDIFMYLHHHSYIHRDIKAENFLVGNATTKSGKEIQLVYLIDFGLAKKYRNSVDDKSKAAGYVHLKHMDNKNLVGTARYASVHSHQGEELSRRDDMESIMYLLIYFVRGRLPWQGITGETASEKYRKIGEQKAKLSIQEICDGLPVEFQHCLTHVRLLEFKDRPNYAYIREMLTGLFRSLGYKPDYQYDWTK